MNDAEYERIVAELKGSKAHRARTDDWLYRLVRLNAHGFTDLIRQSAWWRRNKGADGFDATLRRAEDLCARIKALSIWQATESLMDVAAKHAKALHAAQEQPVDIYDRALAEIAGELAYAESLPRGE